MSGSADSGLFRLKLIILLDLSRDGVSLTLSEVHLYWY